MFHLLILSVGSLLGQNILDLLEGRRRMLRVTGLNTECDNPRVFRCDSLYKSPVADSPEFEPFLLSVIEKEGPDLVLAGRDEDTILLAKLVEKYPNLAKKIPTGSLHAAEVMFDKALSYEFAVSKNLPFAKTLILEHQVLDNVLSWAEETGYPLFAKPRKGFGSHGCKYIVNQAQVIQLYTNNRDGFLLQELLDHRESKKNYIANFQQEIQSGIPVFSHLPDYKQYAGQTLILPDGTISDIFTSVSTMVIGRCERAEIWKDTELSETVRLFAQAMSEIGWRGVFNLQCKQNKNQYIAHEMNGRLTGSTSARLYMGFDEFSRLVSHFIGYVPEPDPRMGVAGDGYVYRSLTDYYISYAAINTFETKGIWRKTN